MCACLHVFHAKDGSHLLLPSCHCGDAVPVSTAVCQLNIITYTFNALIIASSPMSISMFYLAVSKACRRALILSLWHIQRNACSPPAFSLPLTPCCVCPPGACVPCTATLPGAGPLPCALRALCTRAPKQPPSDPSSGTPPAAARWAAAWTATTAQLETSS